MKLYISANLKVSDIKEAFHAEFPFLKLEFFKKKHKPGEGTLLDDIKTDDTLLVDILGVMREGEIEITPAQTVNDLEQLLQRKYNLPVQVFRQMGNLWIETTETDKFTLERQNRIGQEATTPKQETFHDEEQD